MADLRGFDLAFAKNLAREAGRIQRLYFRPFGMERELKPDDTPVTRADHEINALVIQRVRERCGNAVSIIGEEGASTVAGAEWTVSFDPLDGTFPYAHGIPVSTFSLALLHQGRPVIGVIYDPFCDQMFAAEQGKSSLLNGAPIRVSTIAKLGPRASVGLVWWKGSGWNVGKLAAALPETGTTVLNLCSIAYMGAKVASGELVATVFPGLQPHDSAALQLVVEQAGGRVTSIEGGSQRYDGPVTGHLASNALVHEELLERLRACGT